MTSKTRLRHKRSRKSESGIALIETMIALAVLLIVAVGVMSLTLVAMTTTENQGHLQARTSEYAQDKMEQLLGLAFCDATTDTSVIPPNAAGGKGLAGCPTPLVTAATGDGGSGGSSDPSNPASGYVDYLDSTGNLIAAGAGGAAPAGWYYMRVWQISMPATMTNMKLVTVTVRTAAGIGKGVPPQSTVSAFKSYPF